MTSNKLKIGVLMGGKGSEHEVSFNSGRTICDHLDRSRYEVIPLFQRQSGQLYILPWQFLYRGKISDFEHRLDTQAKQIVWDDLITLVDFVYIALHGRFAEDGTVQGMLEILGIPYLGAKVFSSALCMDKIILKDFLRISQIDVPRDVIVQSTTIEQGPSCIQNILDRMASQGITFPCIVKPHKEGSSLGMTLVQNQNDLYQALLLANTIYPSVCQDVLIEEFVRGMEFTCIILIDHRTNTPVLLPPTEVVPEPAIGFFDYEQKYMPGRATKFTPARCAPSRIKKIHDVCLKVMSVLEIETIGRIDGILTADDRVVIIDPNTLTGMGPSSFIFRQAAARGIHHSALIHTLIESELYKTYQIKGDQP